MTPSLRALRAARRFACVVAIGWVVAACSSGSAGSNRIPGPGQPPPPPPPPAENRPPVAVDDVLEVTGAGVANLNVLANDSDPDGDALTVTIVEPAFVGAANVNAAGTSVRIDGLPSGFRGYTRFRYRITDARGATAEASAAVFVDAKSFRLVYAADDVGADREDLYLANLAGAPVRIASVSEGALRPRSVEAASSGDTIAYVRADPANADATQELWFVRTDPLVAPARIGLPAGTRLVGPTPYVVSPDGRWIAFVAAASEDSPTRRVYLVDVTTNSAPRALDVAEAPTAVALGASGDSRWITWVGQSAQGSAVYGLDLQASGSAPVRLSAAPTPDATLVGYELVDATSRIVVARATSDGNGTIAVIDPATPGTERVVNHAPASGTTIFPAPLVSPDGQFLLYATTRRGGGNPPALLPGDEIWQARLDGTGEPRVVVARAATRAIPLAIRPDGGAVLYTRLDDAAPSERRRLYEAPLGAGPGAETFVTEFDLPVQGARFVGYDGTNDRVVYERGVFDDPDVLQIIEATSIQRNAFGGSGVDVGGTDLVTTRRIFGAIDRSVLILTENPRTDLLARRPVSLANLSLPTSVYAVHAGRLYGIDGIDVRVVDGVPTGP